MAKAIDMVNAPPHYTFGGPQYEVILVIEAWGLDKDFLLANAVKYIARAGKKNPEKEVEDLEKAQWYLERKINNLKHEAREAASKAFDKLTMKGSK